MATPAISARAVITTQQVKYPLLDLLIIQAKSSMMIKLLYSHNTFK